MTCRVDRLSVLAYADGFTLWRYRTPDALQDVLERGYFTPAADMLHVGDAILTNVGIQPNVAGGALLWVSVKVGADIVVSA